jgi:hypothetical protein
LGWNRGLAERLRGKGVELGGTRAVGDDHWQRPGRGRWRYILGKPGSVEVRSINWPDWRAASICC